MEKPILPKSWQDHPKSQEIGKIDQCGISQFNFYIGGTYTPSPTFHTPNEQHVLTSLKYKKKYQFKEICSALFRVSPRAEPPLPSQL